MGTRLLLLFTVVVWGSTFVATKILLGYVNPMELLGLRMLIGIPLLALLLLAKRVKLSFTRREHAAILVGSAIVTAHFIIQITGLQYTTATNTGWLIAITPLALAILSYFFLKEHIGKWTIVGIIVATAGVVALVSKGRLNSIGWLESEGDWLVLASAFTWAGYTAATKHLSQTRNPLAVTFAVFLPMALISISYVIYHHNWNYYTHLPAEPLIALAFLAVLGTAAGQWFWQIGVARIGAARAGIFLYIEPLASTLLGVTYLKEPFGVYTAVGAALVMTGVIIAERRKQ